MALHEKIETVTFDSFSTVVDIASGEQILQEYVDDPAAVSSDWRTWTLWFRVLANHLGYRPHYDVNADSLRYTLEQYGVHLEMETIENIAHQVYHTMEPFDDVHEGMRRLDDAGYDLYIVSNGDPDVLDSMVANAEIEDFIEDTISSEEVQVFKPHFQLYKHAAERTGSAPGEIIHVATPWMDVQGAMYAGMYGGWCNRNDQPRGMWVYDGDPDLIPSDFLELADALDA